MGMNPKTSESGNPPGGNKIVRHPTRAVESLRQMGIVVKARPGRTMLVVDCSSSMCGDKLQQARDGATTYVQLACAKNYMIGLIGFGTEPRLIHRVGADVASLTAALEELSASGTTNLADAIRLAALELGNNSAIRTMTIITDGCPDDAEKAIQTASDARDIGIEIVAIGTSDADLEFLTRLTGSPGSAVYCSEERLALHIASAAKSLPVLSRGKD